MPRVALVAAAVLALGATPAPAQTFLADLPTGFTDPVTDGLGNSSFAYDEDMLDADASRVVFTSHADGMSAADDDRFSNVFVRDRDSGETILVSAGMNGEPADGQSSEPHIDDGGNLVVFQSHATNLVPDAPESGVYVRDIAAGTTELVSRRDTANGVAASEAFEPAIAGDGEHVVFTTGDALATGDDNGTFDVYSRSLVDDDTELVSRANGMTGAVGNGPSVAGSIEGDAVAFQSDATNLVPGVTDTNGDEDVFVRWLSSAPLGEKHQTLLVSSRDGAAATTGNDTSGEPSIGPDGNLVAFRTWADDLDADVLDENDASDVMLRDLSAGHTLVSRSTGAAGAVGDESSSNPEVGVDGDDVWVAFGSEATNLVDGTGGDPVSRAYIRHVDDPVPTTVLLSRGNGHDAAPAPDGTEFVSVDADASHAAFVARGSGYGVPVGDFPDVLVRNLGTGTNEIASLPTGDTPLPERMGLSAPAGEGAFSADGRYVLFQSGARRLLPAGLEDTPFAGHVYRRDLLTGELVLVSRADGQAGVPAVGETSAASISADGQRAAFVTTDGLDDADHNGFDDVYVRDVPSGRTFLASRADGAAGAAGDDRSNDPDLSADGRHVAFASHAGNLPDAGNTTSVYVRDLAAGTTRLVSRADGADGERADAYAENASISGDGRYVAFISGATNLDGADSAGRPTAWVRDLVTHDTSVVRRGGDQLTASERVLLSDDGLKVAFDLRGLPPDSPEGDMDVYVHDRTSGQTVLASRADGGAGAEAGTGVSLVGFSGDGDSVAIHSDYASNLGADAPAIYVRRLSTSTTAVISRNVAGEIVRDHLWEVAGLDRDGSCAVFGGVGRSMVGPGLSPDFSRVAVHALRGTCPERPPVPGPGGGGDPVVDTTAPVITRLKVRPKVIRRRTKRPRIRMRLSEAASVRMVIQRVRGKKRRRRAALSRTLAAGSQRVVMRRKLRRKLGRGRFRLRAVATDPAGNRSARRIVRFRVRR